jgi:hypothetical protein
MRISGQTLALASSLLFVAACDPPSTSAGPDGGARPDAAPLSPDGGGASGPDGGALDGGGTDLAAWLPSDWPSDLADPIAAGARTLEVVLGNWRLDLRSAAPDAPCEALDCPGASDGRDPLLGASYDVTGYHAVVVPPTRLWRDLSVSKNLLEASSGLGQTYGRVVTFYRRAIDGALLVVSATSDPASPSPGADDFWNVAFADDGEHVRFAIDDPLVGDDAPIRIEIQPGAIVVHTEDFAFRAPSVAEELEDTSLPAEFADLRGTPTPERALELVRRALEIRRAQTGLVAEILITLGHADTAVRLASVDYLVDSFDWDENVVSRLLIVDRMTERLLRDPSVEVRAAVAAGLHAIFEGGDFAYHCALEWAMEECVATETSSEIAADCRATLDLPLPRYGHCPWR